MAGYQGVSYKKEVTTLGRGGSDTTAVALAAALDAQACEFYSDVEGVYSADPRVVPDAVRLSELSYEEMQELAEAGARVLNAQAVEFAKDRGIALYARASSGEPGETVVRKLPAGVPARLVGVASQVGLVQLTFTDGPATLGDLIAALERRGVAGKQLLFRATGPASGGSLLLSLENLHDFASLRTELAALFGDRVRLSEGLGAVSVIGTGINSSFETLRRCLLALAGIGAELRGLSTSSFRISLLLDERHMQEAVKRLHAGLAVGGVPSKRS